MRKILLSATVITCCPVWAAINVPLTIQEALYPGSTAGANRTADPITVGVPLPDDPVTGIIDVNQVTLAGAAVGQFRVLGRWPSGRIKWLLVDTRANVTAGQPNSSIILKDGGTGNFGGPNLATDNGSTIAVSTGAATFTIRKANFNVVDQAIVGTTTVVASGSSQGLVVTGPAPGQTTCPPCTTVYSSANDSSSTAVIEENGPAKAVIRATGSHVDASGNVYMRFTMRMFFYQGKTLVKLTSVLRNADYGTSNSFATAYKGHQGYELRIAANLGGTATYSIGNHTGSPSTETVSGTDSVYLYQGESNLMKWQDWCGFGCVPYTSDSGYSIVKNGSTMTSGTSAQHPQGWADIRNGNGAGVSIGVYQLPAYWPKSLEFNAGGTDVRIGIWPRQNSQPYYQVWPQWSSHELYLNFHGSALASPADEFVKFQHYLVGRAPYTHYNAAGVFPYTLIDPVLEDNFYKNTATQANPSTIPIEKACCIQDLGVSETFFWPLNVYRFYSWGSGGGANQTEFRWSRLLNFLTRGMTGRYLDAAHFYHFQAESTWPHSDGFSWRDRLGEYNGFGYPTAASANSERAFRNWRDQEHAHWYGMTDYYFMSGNETIKDALMDGVKDWFLNPNTYQNAQSGGMYNTRSIGVQLIGSARFARFLRDIGDADAETVLDQGKSVYSVQVKPDLCVSGYPNGCSLGPPGGGPWNTQGVSRVRGVHWGAAGTSGTWCGVSHSYRVNSSFQPSILIQGLLELRNVAGTGWSDYWTALDLAYGVARWNLSENYVDNGTGRWDGNGFRFGLALDVPNSCTAQGESPEPNFLPGGSQTTAMTFLPLHLVDGGTPWKTKFQINLQKLMAAIGITTSDFGSYQIAEIINTLTNPRPLTLTTVPITGFVDRGAGSYTISWVVPPDSDSYRIKWGSKQIVDWIGFDPANNVFVGDPATRMPWFAATDAPSIPSPGAPGTTQSITFGTGATGLTPAHFSVKAYIRGTSVTTSPSPNLLLVVGGNNQSGTVGQQLATPFTVKVTDANGNPIPGHLVVFTVIAGGGTLTAANVTTDSQGLAATRLTLGLNPGVNQVMASATGLTGSPITFSATATATAPDPTPSGLGVNWTVKPRTAGWPGYNGWLTTWYDPVSRQTILYGTGGQSTSIYSTDVFFYNSSTNVFTHLGGTGSLTSICPADTPTWPGDRHPGWQMAIDTRRNFLWLYGGVCQGIVRQSLYYLRLNADPLQDTWNQVSPAHFPAAATSAAMVYDPDADVLFAFGSDGGPQTHNNWVYCRTLENPTPGVLTTRQAAAGCVAPDDWSEVSVVGGIRPPAVAFPGMVYEPATKKAILYGGNDGSLTVSYNQTWAYDIPTRTWTQKALSTNAPPAYSAGFTAQPTMALNPVTNKIIYHQTSNTGAPADWQYDPVADTWTKLVSVGGGATVEQFLAYDAATNLLIGMNRSANGLEVWHGDLSTPVGSPGPGCDLNSDGAVSVLDVQVAVTQALGITSCGTADLDRNGACNFTDVQRIIVASLGGACRVGL